MGDTEKSSPKVVMVAIDSFATASNNMTIDPRQQQPRQAAAASSDHETTTASSSPASTTSSSSSSNPTAISGGGRGDSSGGGSVGGGGGLYIENDAGFSVQVREATPAFEEEEDDEDGGRNASPVERKRKITMTYTDLPAVQQRFHKKSLEDPGPSNSVQQQQNSSSSSLSGVSRLSRERRHSNITNPFLTSSHLDFDPIKPQTAAAAAAATAETQSPSSFRSLTTCTPPSSSNTTAAKIDLSPSDQLLVVPPSSLIPPEEVVDAQTVAHRHHHHHVNRHQNKPPVASGIRREHRHHSHRQQQQQQQDKVQSGGLRFDSAGVGGDVAVKRGSSITRCSHMMLQVDDGSGNSKSQHVVQRTQSNPEMECCPVCLARKECEILLKRTYSKVNCV